MQDNNIYYTIIVFFEDRPPVKYRNIKHNNLQTTFISFIKKKFDINKPTVMNIYNKLSKDFLQQIAI